MAYDAERQIYTDVRGWQRPSYPFQVLDSPHIEALAVEYYGWIDADCIFESSAAREVHKRHRLTDIAARAFPRLTLRELRPIARFTAFLAILDDYMDRSDADDIRAVQNRIQVILRGQDQRIPEPGFYHQIHALRQESLQCGMESHHFDEFISSIDDLMVGYGREKEYNAKNEPPPLATYQSIRRQTSGGLCYAKYLCMHRDYRTLPVEILRHPNILRLHDLAASIIGYHNDFISLPKELSRRGDVVNVVLSIQRDQDVELKKAYDEALEIHDSDLTEFMRLQNELPDFGQWQETARQYVRDLGVMIQGVYTWHVENTGRYVPGAYVEPEHNMAKENWQEATPPRTRSGSAANPGKDRLSI